MVARWLVGIAVIGCSFAAAYLGGSAARIWSQPRDSGEVIEGLEIARADLEKGEVWEAKDYACQLPIRNRTQNSIGVRDFATSCGCIAVKPRSLSIPPGETVAVTLTIDLTHRRLEEYGLDRRPLDISIQPLLSTPRPVRGRVWRLTGTIRSRVTLDAQNVHFGDQPIHGQSAVTRRVLAMTHVPCKDLEVKVNPTIAKAIIKPREEERAFEILISPNPDLPPGPFQTSAVVNVIAPTGERLSGVELPIAGTMQPEVRLLPTHVLLESTSVGETAEAVVTLQTPPGIKVVIDHFETDSSGLRVEAMAVDGIPEHHAFRIRQRVDSEGERTSTVRCVLRGADGKMMTRIVEICSRGQAVKKTPPERGKQ